MDNNLDKLVEEYKVAIKNKDKDKIIEIENFFKKIGFEPFGLQIMAFA